MGWHWHWPCYMQTIFTSLQTDNHTNSASLNFYRPNALPDTQPTVSKHTRHRKEFRNKLTILPDGFHKVRRWLLEQWDNILVEWIHVLEQPLVAAVVHLAGVVNQAEVCFVAEVSRLLKLGVCRVLSEQLVNQCFVCSLWEPAFLVDQCQQTCRLHTATLTVGSRCNKYCLWHCWKLAGLTLGWAWCSQHIWGYSACILYKSAHYNRIFTVVNCWLQHYVTWPLLALGLLYGLYAIFVNQQCQNTEETQCWIWILVTDV